MDVVAGFFPSPHEAVRAARSLRGAVPEARVRVVVDDGATAQLEDLPSDESEPPGTGAAIGAVVGGAAAASIAAAAIPLAAPFAVVGIAAGGLLGGAAGLAAGRRLEHSLSEGLPQDEVVRWREAVERGQAIVVAYADEPSRVESIARLLREEGAAGIYTP